MIVTYIYIYIVYMIVHIESDVLMNNYRSNYIIKLKIRQVVCVFSNPLNRKGRLYYLK